MSGRPGLPMRKAANFGHDSDENRILSRRVPDTSPPRVEWKRWPWTANVSNPAAALDTLARHGWKIRCYGATTTIANAGNLIVAELSDDGELLILPQSNPRTAMLMLASSIDSRWSDAYLDTLVKRLDPTATPTKTTAKPPPDPSKISKPDARIPGGAETHRRFLGTAAPPQPPTPPRPPAAPGPHSKLVNASQGANAPEDRQPLRAKPPALPKPPPLGR